MRTTVELEPDIAKAIDELRSESGRGVSAAINELIRRGLLAAPPSEPYVARTKSLGMKIDVSNVAEALDILEGPDAR